MRNTIPGKSGSWRPHEWRHPKVTLLESVLLTLMKFPLDGHFGTRNHENSINLAVSLLHGQPFVCNKLIFYARLKVNIRVKIKPIVYLHVLDDYSGEEPGSIVANPCVIVPDPEV